MRTSETTASPCPLPLEGERGALDTLSPLGKVGPLGTLSSLGRGQGEGSH
jgi:hypothetical protein